MSNKITKRENYGMLMELAKTNQREDLVTFIEHELELLDKKANTVSKADMAKAELNKGLKEEIMLTLCKETELIGIKGLQAKNEKLAGYSSSKISYLLGELVKAGKVEKQAIKRIMHYKAI